MMRTFIIGSTFAMALVVSATTLAQQGQFGTAQEAKSMLDKAVSALKADQAVALAMFNKGEGGFRDRDLYPFCFRVADGKYVANPALAVPAGTDTHTLKDPTGKVFGEDLYAAAQKPEGQITEVSYMFPKPGTTAPAVPKVSFVTRVGDLGCGVGYYK
jgi:Single Cache domain 2